MGNIKKKDAIKIVTDCAKKYDEHLAGKTLLFVCIDKQGVVSSLELNFDAGNYMHLTGLVPTRSRDAKGNEYILTPKDFYKKCLDNKLKEQEFEFDKNGTTPLKLEVLSYIMNGHLSASMVGDFNSLNPKLYTEKLVGGVKACVGFVRSKGQGRYVPNTLLKEDIRNNVSDCKRVIAVFRKNRADTNFTELTYKASNVKWDLVKISKENVYFNLLNSLKPNI